MKIQRHHILAGVMLAAASVLAACSSSALPVTRPVSVPDPGAAVATGKNLAVHVRIFIPRRHHRDARSMRPFFVANSTRGIAVIVSAHGSSTPASTTNASVASGSPLCKAVSGGRQCTITAGAPPGDDDFAIKTYDAAPAKGGFSGAKQLAYGFTTKTIAGGKANSLKVTVGGVVARAAVHLSWPVNPVIDADTQTVTVSALDADGNTIISDGWYSAAGTAVKVAMSAGNGATGMFAFAPASVTFASPTTKLTYSSTKATPAQVQNGFTSTVSAKPDNGAAPGTAIFTQSKPKLTEFPLSTGTAYPEGITVGPDDAIWFVENIGNAIGRITTNAAAGTHPAEYSSGMHSSASPVAIAVAPDDHKLWFTEFSNNKVASIDPTSHTITEYGTGLQQPYGITAGSDGNMWFAENCTTHSYIGKFNANALDGSVGSINEYATASSSAAPAWIAPGPNGNLWFTEPGVDAIGTMPTSGSEPNEFPLAANSIGEGQIAPGPDNALWFAEENPNAGHAIGRVTAGGSVTLPYQFLIADKFTSPYGIVTGPDGALWFTENGANKIGRIDPATKTLVEFTLPESSNAAPWGIVKGPDGALWFTECTGNNIGRLH